MERRISFSLFVLICFLISGFSSAQAPAYIPTNGLLAWFPFTGNANDLWVNSHNGTVNGPVLTTDRFNSANSAYQFDGINDYISVPDNAVNFRPQNFTVSSWVLFNTIPYSHKMVVAKNVAGYTPIESIDMNYAGQLNSWFCNIGAPSVANGPYLTQTFPISTNTWYHFLYQFDDINNVQKIYINGVFTASSAVNMSVGYDTQPWTFGTEYENGYLSYFFNGKIDDIGIWDRMLTPCEISQVYQAATIGPSLTISSATICAGQIASLSVSGANSYTWNPGNLAGASVTLAPNISTTYSVSGTNTLGCTGNSTTSIKVDPRPVIIVTGIPSSVCAGGSVILSASGANTYTWNPGSAYGSSIAILPTVTTVYSVTGISSLACPGIASITIVVNPNPVLSVTGIKGVICLGNSIVLNASGAISYSWSTLSNNASVTISPSVTTTYTVSGTDANGCESFTTVTQNVNTCAGINNLSNNDKLLTSYPNPFQDVLVIEGNQFINNFENGDLNIEIVNAFGQLVLNENYIPKNNSVLVNTGNFASGTYILKIRIANIYRYLKVVKS